MEVVSNRFIPDVKTIVAGADVMACTFARRWSVSGGKVMEMRAGGGGNVRFEINWATQLITPNL